MAGNSGMSPEAVRAEQNRLEISPSEKDTGDKTKVFHGGHSSKSASGGSSIKESGFSPGSVPGYGKKGKRARKSS